MRLLILLLLLSTTCLAQTQQPARRLSGKITSVSQYDSLVVKVWDMADMSLVESKVYRNIHKGDFYNLIFHTANKRGTFHIKMESGSKWKDIYLFLANMGHDDLVVDMSFVRNSTLIIFRENANKEQFQVTEIKENGTFETTTYKFDQ